MARIDQAPGLQAPFINNFPQPVVSRRDPTVNDSKNPIGMRWINKATNKTWTLTSVSSGAANWSLSSAGGGDVQTINSLPPTAGNIIVDGGTNLTDSNAGSTVTLNMNDDITLNSIDVQELAVQEIDTNFLASTGTDLILRASPIMQTALATGGPPTTGDGDTNLMCLQDGAIMEEFLIGTQTFIAPRMLPLGPSVQVGLNIALDQAFDKGAEYNFGARPISKHSYTIGVDPAFFMEAQFTVETLAGAGLLMIGFRKVEANNTTFTNYTDYACIGLRALTSVTNLVMVDRLNSGSQDITDSTDAWNGGDGGVQRISVLVSAAGVVTFTISGSAPTITADYTFDDMDVVMPICHFVNGEFLAAGDVGFNTLKVGLQA